MTGLVSGSFRRKRQDYSDVPLIDDLIRKIKHEKVKDDLIDLNENGEPPSTKPTFPKLDKTRIHKKRKQSPVAAIRKPRLCCIKEVITQQTSSETQTTDDGKTVHTIWSKTFSNNVVQTPTCTLVKINRTPNSEPTMKKSSKTCVVNEESGSCLISRTAMQVEKKDKGIGSHFPEVVVSEPIKTRDMKIKRVSDKCIGSRKSK